MTSALNTLHQIIRDGLCHRCGSCAGICPKGVIEPDDDYYPQWDDRIGECTDCGLCVRVCPGIDFSFPHYSRALFGREAIISDAHGLYLKAFLGYSTDPAIRGNATSGGIGTQLPLYMIEAGKARGAFAVVPDGARPWKPRAVIARTREDFAWAALSKYPACSLNHLFREIQNDAGPFVLTGLPCHLHGFRKMAELNPAIEEKVALAIGLFCHSCLDHQAIRDILDIYGIEENDIERLEYRGGKLPGYIRALTKNGEWVYIPYPHLGPDKYRPNAKECLTFFFKFYSPPRCRLCMDASSEFGDISIGDPWYRGWEADEKLREGYSLIITRTQKGLRILEDAQKAGAIKLEPFADESVPESHAAMIRRKRMRAMHNIARRARRGLSVPEYGYSAQSFMGGRRIRAALHTATYFSAERPWLRKPLFSFLLSRPGRIIVGAFFFPRRVLQAAWENMKVRLSRKPPMGGSLR